MKLREEDIWWKSTDQRIGMGISCWHMRYELIHTPTNVPLPMNVMAIRHRVIK